MSRDGFTVLCYPATGLWDWCKHPQPCGKKTQFCHCPSDKKCTVSATKCTQNRLTPNHFWGWNRALLISCTIASLHSCRSVWLLMLWSNQTPRCEKWLNLQLQKNNWGIRRRCGCRPSSFWRWGGRPYRPVETATVPRTAHQRARRPTPDAGHWRQAGRYSLRLQLITLTTRDAPESRLTANSSSLRLQHTVSPTLYRFVVFAYFYIHVFWPLF